MTKKKKMRKKHKIDVNKPTMTVSICNVEETSSMHWKPKCPCKLCKGDHFLIDYPSIPKVLEVVGAFVLNFKSFADTKREK